MCQVAVCGDDGTMTVGIKLGSPSSAKDLKHIKNPKVLKRTSLSIVDFCPLKENVTNQSRDHI